MADGTLPHFIPDRRERLLDALASLGEPQDVMINTRLWGHVIIDTQACTSCRMCAVFCPTAALRKFEREDGTIGVEHYPGDCVKCHTCEAICPGHCLEISEEVFAREMLAGKTDEYTMKPLEVEVGSAHTIWNKYKNLATIAEVYER
jgi:formate hydrogenlyase subunit 6/NADH:ubiquinone oxidoreductase subunit I